MGKWIEILKPGTFISSSGKPVTFTKEDLDTIAASNPATDRKTPLVFGHPEDNGPAFGWLEKIKHESGKLKAMFKQVPDAVKEAVNAGHYKNVSISLMPDKKTLRHVGLLGAAQPAVPGLEAVSFSDNDEQLIIEFSTEKKGEQLNLEEMKAENERLKAEKEAADKRAEMAESEAETAKTELTASKADAEKKVITDKVNGLVGKTILAKDKDVVEGIALALGGSDSIEFSDGNGKKVFQDAFLDFMSGLPDLGLMDDFTMPKKNDNKSMIESLSKYM